MASSKRTSANVTSLSSASTTPFKISAFKIAPHPGSRRSFQGEDSGSAQIGSGMDLLVPMTATPPCAPASVPAAVTTTPAASITSSNDPFGAGPALLLSPNPGQVSQQQTSQLQQPAVPMQQPPMMQQQPPMMPQPPMMQQPHPNMMQQLQPNMMQQPQQYMMQQQYPMVPQQPMMHQPQPPIMQYTSNPMIPQQQPPGFNQIAQQTQPPFVPLASQEQNLSTNPPLSNQPSTNPFDLMG